MAEQNQPKKFAIQTLRRAPDGRMRTVLIDASTGQEITDTTGYTIITAGNQQNMQFGNQEEESTAQEVIRQTKRPDNNQASDDFPNRGFASNTSSQQVDPRSAQNNYNFFDKPNWMGLTSFIPGPLGMAGKAANLGANINNMAATRQAREELNLQPPNRGFLGTLKDVVKGPNPYVGNLSTSQGELVPISLTPNLAAGPGFAVDPATAQSIGTDQESQNFLDMMGSMRTQPEEKENTEGGLFSRVTGIEEGAFGRAASDFISNMFGGGNNTTQNRTNYFPPAPTSSTRSTGPSPSSPAGGSRAASGGFASGGGSSISPAAQDAIDSGVGGLF